MIWNRLKRFWSETSLFWKIFLLSTGLALTVVLLGEGAEDLPRKLLFERLFPDTPAGHKKAAEAVSWGVAIILSALGGGLILSRITAGPLKRLQAAVEKLSRGHLASRVAGPDAERGDEIGQLARGFNQMADNLTTLLATERRLMRDISHELRSPLARMKMALALMEKRGDGHGAAESYRRQLNKDIQLMDEMVDELLEEARLESMNLSDNGESPAGGPSEPPAGVDLALIVQESVDRLAWPAQNEGKTIALSRPEAAPLLGHETLLRRIVDNLVKNALTHTPPKTAVSVHLKAFPEQLALEISDQGPGVPPEQLEHIFRPFYRADASRNRSSGGFGLGLAIVRQAVRVHHGQVRAANAPGGGLTVTVTLPRPPDSPDAAN